MSILSKLFSRKQAQPSEPNDPLVPVPMPALGVILANLEKSKGSSLTEAEVLEARDKCICIMLPLSKQHAMEQSRGYRDINPENCWAEWLAYRVESR